MSDPPAPTPHMPYNLDALVARARQWLRAQDLIPDALKVYALVARFRREELQDTYRHPQHARRTAQQVPKELKTPKEASGGRPTEGPAQATD